MSRSQSLVPKEGATNPGFIIPPSGGWESRRPQGCIHPGLWGDPFLATAVSRGSFGSSPLLTSPQPLSRWYVSSSDSDPPAPSHKEPHDFTGPTW